MKKLIVIVIAFISLLGAAADTWNQVLSEYVIIDIEKNGDDYWLATESNGAFRYSAENNRWYRYNKETGSMSKTDDVYDMEIINGRVWFATSYGIYSCAVNGSGWKNELPQYDIMDNWVLDIAQNSTHVYLATFGGLVVYSKSSKTYTAVDISVNSDYKTGQTKSVEANDQFLWVGTEDGVVKVDLSLGIENSASKTYYGTGTHFVTDGNYSSVLSICVDENGEYFGLEEYGESYSRGGLFLKNGDTWTVVNDDSGLTGNGIHFIESFGNTLFAGLFSYVDGVNYNGKGLLEYDMLDSSVTVLDSSNWHLPSNGVRSFYCDEQDTLVGTDAGLMCSDEGMPDLAPFDKVAGFSVQSLGNGDCRILTTSIPYADRYVLEYIQLGDDVLHETILTDTCDTVSGFVPGICYSFSLRAANQYGSAPACDNMMVCGVSETANDILLVNGFDSDIAVGNIEYMARHAEAFADCDLGFDACSDDMVENGQIAMGTYAISDWFCGIDATAMSEECKESIKNYLEQGGKLFLSGAQFVEKLAGAENDTAFYGGYLKSVWKKSDTRTYEACGMSRGVFRGIGNIQFDDGDHGSYNVSRPDGFIPKEGACSALVYADKDTLDFGFSAVSYTGTFGESEMQSKLLYMGIPFESIYPDSMRHALMACIMSYFDKDVQLTARQSIDKPDNFILRQNYPNPFNPVTQLQFSLQTKDQINLSIYDCSGRLVSVLCDGSYSAGNHTSRWNAEYVASGVYFAVLKTSSESREIKMMLLK